MTKPSISAFCTVGAAYVVIVADQIAKILALRVHHDAIVPAQNHGLITGMSPMTRPVLVAVSLVVLGAFLLSVGRWAVQIGIAPVIPAVIAGGIAAHALDRFRFGAVRDFLSTGWLIVDVADFAVAGGLIALGIAFGRRWLQLRRAQHTVVIQMPTMRAVIVDQASVRAA